MAIETHTDWITGSYTTDVQYVLEVAENNALLNTPTLANLGPKLDSVESVFIGYGYDLLQQSENNNAAQVVAALQSAGATIIDPAGLENLLESLKAPVSQADLSNIASYISVTDTPTAISNFAALLLQNTISSVEGNLTTFLEDNGIGVILPSNERVALMDLYYQDPGGNGKSGYFLNADNTLTNLSQALQSGNRAEAWFEIRYRSADGGKQGLGLVARRYVDGQLFGLYANPSAPTETEALQAYQMLTANRSTIINYELQFGSDPYGAGALTPSGEIASANQTYLRLSGPNEVQTLAQAFDAAAAEEISYLEGLYGGILNIEINDTGGGGEASFDVRSVDFYAASPTDQDVDAMVSYAPQAEAVVDDSADHILLGSETGDTLIGALGNDILVAQAGNEWLESGSGSDTLIANGGNDTIQAQGVSDVMDFVFPTGSSGYIETVEMNSASAGVGALYVNGSQIGGNLSPSGQDTWTDQSGNTYTFIPNPSNPPPGYSPAAGGSDVGELQILVGGQGGNEIDIWGFNLSEAESATGYVDIDIPPGITVVGGSTDGSDPSAADFIAGSSQSYTVSVSAPSASTQTVTMTLSGASPSDFGLISDTTVVPLNSDGTFTVTIPAGQTSVSFSLVNTGDVGSDASLQLVATIPDPNDPTAGPISSTPLTQSYVEPAQDPFGTPVAPQLYYYGLY